MNMKQARIQCRDIIGAVSRDYGFGFNLKRTEWGEYRVELTRNCKLVSDYETDDLDDAVGTLNAMVRGYLKCAR